MSGWLIGLIVVVLFGGLIALSNWSGDNVRDRNRHLDSICHPYARLATFTDSNGKDLVLCASDYDGGVVAKPVVKQ